MIMSDMAVVRERKLSWTIPLDGLRKGNEIPVRTADWNLISIESS
jgi:hypothetical protein